MNRAVLSSDDERPCNEAQEKAIAGAGRIIKACDVVDSVTQMGDEEQHRGDFIGLLKEYEDSQT